tara:strand:+ start:27 stop:209 length:183 start_codon:yes stop_codon:yes gene_type:complete
LEDPFDRFAPAGLTTAAVVVGGGGGAGGGGGGGGALGRPKHMINPWLMLRWFRSVRRELS